MKTIKQTECKPGRRFTKKAVLIILILLYSTEGYSCINCNPDVRQAIKSSFVDNPLLLLGFILLALVVTALSIIVLRKPEPNKRNLGGLLNSPKTPLAATGMVLGIGLGGFIDGIVLHQILQWHEMLSNKIPPSTIITKSANMFWDGIFHMFTLLVTLLGIWLLWKVFHNENSSKSSNLLSGGMISGWAIFNLLEGILNHHILKLHNVRELSNSPDWWNYGFLFFSIILLFIGIQQLRRTSISGIDNGFPTTI